MSGYAEPHQKKPISFSLFQMLSTCKKSKKLKFLLKISLMKNLTIDIAGQF